MYLYLKLYQVSLRVQVFLGITVLWKALYVGRINVYPVEVFWQAQRRPHAP